MPYPRLLPLLLVACFAGPAAAQTDLSLMTVPWPGDRPVDAGGDVTFIPTETDGAGAPDLDLTIARVAGRFRPDRGADNKLTFGYEFTHFDVDTLDAALPDHLTSAALAVGGEFGAFNAFDQDWNWGGSAGVGFASSNTFGDGNGWYGLASFFATTKVSDVASLMVGLDYDGNRAIFPDVPLPTVALTVRHSDAVAYTLGFPVSFVRWAPDDRWTLRASVAGLAFGAEARYRLDDTFALFGKYGGNGEAFHVSGGDGDRRLFYSAQYLEAGVEVTLTDTASLVVAGGYAFDQEFETGFDVRDLDTVRELDDAGYIRVGGVLRF